MNITLNTQTFNLESQAQDAVVYAKAGTDLATPYRIKQSRVLPSGNTKTAVLRGMSKMTRTFLDDDGIAHAAIVTISSSIPVQASASFLAELEADVEAYAASQASSDVLFKGKIY